MEKACSCIHNTGMFRESEHMITRTKTHRKPANPKSFGAAAADRHCQGVAQLVRLDDPQAALEIGARRASAAAVLAHG